MDISPKVSVIIPVYNAGKYLQQALDSVINQTYKNIEIIIINDGSTDNSAAIIEDYAKKDSRIIFEHIRNQGVSNARNQGLKIASGNYLYCMDSDDTLSHNLIEKCVFISNFDMIVFGAKFVYTMHNAIEQHKPSCSCVLENRDKITGYLSEMTLSDKNLFLNYLWNRLFKLDIIRDNNLQFNTNVSLGEDFLFITKYLSYCNSVCVIEETMYNYYLRGTGSLVSRFDINEYQRRKLMQEAYLNLLDCFNAPPKAYLIFKENEGANYVSSIQKITRPNCPLNKLSDKLDYIKRFIDKDGIGLIGYYIKKHPSKSNRVLELVLRTKSPLLTYLYFVLLTKMNR